MNIPAQITYLLEKRAKDGVSFAKAEWSTLDVTWYVRFIVRETDGYTYTGTIVGTTPGAVVVDAERAHLLDTK